MQCEAIRPRIRPFLDDLLDEKDYAEIHSHLAGCQRCQAYASSVGTLSYRLFELGQVTLPPDMMSTILYEMKKNAAISKAAVTAESPEIPSERRGSPTRALWIAILALGTISIAATGSAFFWRSSKGPAVFSIAGGQSLTAPGALDLLGAPRLEEWHFHLASGSKQDLVDAIIELELAVERESDRSLVFLVPAEKQTLLRERLAASDGFSEFGETPELQPGESARTTVNFG